MVWDGNLHGPLQMFPECTDALVLKAMCSSSWQEAEIYFREAVASVSKCFKDYAKAYQKMKEDGDMWLKVTNHMNIIYA